MAICPECKKSFRVPEDEQDMHGCPSCGHEPAPFEPNICPECGGELGESSRIGWEFGRRESFMNCPDCGWEE